MAEVLCPLLVGHEFPTPPLHHLPLLWLNPQGGSQENASVQIGIPIGKLELVFLTPHETLRGIQEGHLLDTSADPLPRPPCVAKNGSADTAGDSCHKLKPSQPPAPSDVEHLIVR